MALTYSDIKVSIVTQETEQDQFGSPREVSRVYYMIGEAGPYNVSIPKLELTAQRVLQDVRQDAQKYLDVLNLVF